MKNTIALIIIFGFFILVVWFIYQHNSPKQAVVSNIPKIGQRTKEYGCQVNGPFQDKACTPGAFFPDVTADQICVRGYAKSVRNVPVSEKREVYREYGISHHSPGEYEVDHLISLEL